MCYVAISTAVCVRNFARTCYRTCTVTQIIAICKMNGRKNNTIGRGEVFKKAVLSDIYINSGALARAKRAQQSTIGKKIW